MKKLIYILAAAAVILSGCSKEQIAAPEPVAPVNVPECSFFGEFALNKETKTTMLPGVDNYYVMWEQGDIIKVTAQGTELTWEFEAESDGETAIFNVSGKTEEELATFFAASSFTATFGSDASTIIIEKNNVKHLSMAASCGSDRVLTFKVDKPVLAVEIPASVSAKSLSVNPRGSNDPVVSLTCSEAVPVFYVPVPEDTKQYDIHAYSGENRTNEIAESMKMQVAAQMTKGNIYPFEFTPTLEITTAGTHTLKSYPANYKVHILAENTGDTTVNIAYETGAAKHPVNVYIDANGHNTDNLSVTTPNSHVEIEDGASFNVKSETSKNSFVIKPNYRIKTKLTLVAGSAFVEGHEGAANCAMIEIPSTSENINISINTVTQQGQDNQVHIVNNAPQAQVKVIGVKDHEYYITEKNEVTEVTGVAEIGNTKFATLDAAFAAAKSGETVKLLQNVELSAQVELAGKSVTFNLDGKKVTAASAYTGSLFGIHNGAELIVDGDGEISTFASNTINAITLTKDGDNPNVTASIVVNSGLIKGYWYAIAGNGSRQNTSIVVNGGTLYATAGCAIYNPQNGIIAVNGGTIEGTEGIYMKSGSAVVATGGTIHGFGPKGPYIYQSSGSEGTGDAIVVENCNYPGGRPTLTVAGATLISDNAYQIGAYYHTPETDISDIYSTDNTLTAPAEYSWVESGNGMYKLTKVDDDIVAKIGNKGYKSIYTAVEEAVDGQTVVLVKDVALGEDYLNVTKSIDIDLNGHTLTGPATESDDSYVIVYDGYDASPEHTVRISGKVYNGTINSNKIAIYAADHADLVAENLTVNQQRIGPAENPNFNHLALGASFGATLTVNSGTYTGDIAASVFSTGGKITINGGTFVGRDNGVFVYLPNASTPGYAAEGNSEIIIKGGTVTGSLGCQTGTGHKGYIAKLEVSGGTFDNDPTNYCKAGYAAVAQGTSPETWVVKEAEISIVKAGTNTSYTTLAAFRDAVNAGNSYDGYTITLLKDLDLSGTANFTPIGTDKDHPFSGRFDGQGHTISNLSVSRTTEYAGLFGCVTGTTGNSSYTAISDIVTGSTVDETKLAEANYSASIKNLTISGASVSNTKKYAAVLVGEAVNCHISGITVNKSTVSGFKADGLIAGTVQGSAVFNCVTDNQSSITAVSGGYHQAGIVGATGYTGGSANAIIGCTNNATVGGYNQGGYTGGIVAFASEAPLVMKGCTNNGAITLTTDNTAQSVGGVVGRVQGVKAPSVIISCQNTASLTASTSEGFGGILGDRGESSLSFDSCSNSGNLSGSCGYMGGIVGKADQGGKVSMDACYSRGTVSNQKSDGQSSNYIASGEYVTYKNITFVDEAALSNAMPKKGLLSIDILDCVVTDKTGTFIVPPIYMGNTDVRLLANTNICNNILPSSGFTGTIRLIIPDLNTTLSSEWNNIGLLLEGDNQTVTVANNTTLSQLIVGSGAQNTTGSATINGKVNGYLTYQQSGTVTISNGASTAGLNIGPRDRAYHNITIDNYGSIARENTGQNGHVLTTEYTLDNIVVNNHGTISVNNTNASGGGYLLLSYGSKTFRLNNYNGAKLVNTSPNGGYWISTTNGQTGENVTFDIYYENVADFVYNGTPCTTCPIGSGTYQQCTTTVHGPAQIGQ